MNKKILIFFLLLISPQIFAKIGSNINFWILSQKEYNERVLKGKDVILKRHIVVPYLDKEFKDILEIKDEKALFAKFSFMLKKNKITMIEKYIENCDNSLDINNLIKGLYYISKNQYYNAISHLEILQNDDCKFLKFLLIADCRYELLQDKKNYKSIIGLYQIAIDSTNDEQNKSIVHNRIKYIKYH